MITPSESSLAQSEKPTVVARNGKMFSVLKIGLLGLGLGAGMLLVGCKTAPATHAMAADAVQCDTCKTTWVKAPRTTGKGQIVGYSPVKKMACPDCRNAVQNFFETGKLAHTCKACGGNLTMCESH